MRPSGAAAPIEIRAASSDRFRRLLALSRSARERETLGLALIEGEHLVKAWLDSGGERQPEVAIPRRSADRGAITSLCAAVGEHTLLLEDSLFDRLSQVAHGPGPLVAIPVRRPSLPTALDSDAVYLDGIQDPGNAGTLLRSAAAFGVSLIISSPTCVSLWAPKVIRAAMGAHFVLEICEGVTAEHLLSVRGQATPTAAAPRSARSVAEADLRGPRLWLFGAEGQGLSAEIESLPGVERLEIRHHPGVESLNVGVAASICLYEQCVQRGRPARR